MVKAVNVVFGFVLFSLVLSMMFAFIGDTMRLNNIEGAETFDNLAGNYEGFTNEQGASSSTSRGIIEGTKGGPATSEDSSNFLVSGALSGGRQVANFFGNFDNVINNATSNVNQGEVFIDNRITNAILILMTVLIAFVIMHFLRGFKTET